MPLLALSIGPALSLFQPTVSPAIDQPRSFQPRLFAGSLLVVALLVALDLWSKQEVYGWLTGEGVSSLVRDVHGHAHFPIAGEWFSFMASCNPGAAFGQFDNIPLVLVVGRILACGFLTYLLSQASSGQKVLRCAMVLVLSGALGNVIDNLGLGCGSEGFPYGVRDFIAVWFEPLVGWDYHFPSFNVADACISVGAMLWISSGLFGPKDPAESEQPSGKEPA